MTKLMCSAAVLGLFLLPSAANAAAVASISLSADNISVAFEGDITGDLTGLFATASAALGVGGSVSNDTDPAPGVASATASDGSMIANSFISADPAALAFRTDAGGSTVGEVGSAVGEVTGSFDFVVASAGAAITIMMELTRAFDLATDGAFELASGATGLALSILNGGGVIFPTVDLVSAACDPNATFTVSGGTDFLDSCTTMATFTFADLPEGAYTLTFGSNSSVDIVSGVVPVPGALGLFALGLAGFGFARRQGSAKPARMG